MTRQVNLAVVGVPGVVSEALLTILEERDFPVGELFLLGDESSLGESRRCFGKSRKVESVSQFDFTQVELAFFCGDEVLAHANAPTAAESGCIVIDCTDAFRDEPDVPMVIPEVNPEALDGFRARNIIAMPSATTTLLLTVLKPLHDAAAVLRADVVTLEAVSEAGNSGVDELSSQVVSLLNMRDAQTAVFPQRIAFNVCPQVGEITANGYTMGELKMQTQAQKVLPYADITLNPTAVQVPVFYGHSMSVHLQTATTLTADEAVAILRETPGVSLVEQGEVPTPALQAANQDSVFVARVRDALGPDGGLNLWISADNSRKGVALNAVQIAALLEKCYI